MIRRPLACRCLVMAVLMASSEVSPAVSFNEDIRPILADRCFSCHGPDSAARKADLRLDLEGTAKAALSEGVIPIVPGKPGDSVILHRLTSDDPDEVMPPPESKLSVSPAEIDLIRRWITEGAKWERHWAFIPPTKSPPGSLRDHPWIRNEIDHYILHALSAEGLKPSPPAERARLLRRVSFDLTGLPPTIAELDSFLLDNSDDAYERAVDRLLTSPAFGERLGLEWLDVARYGDTDGLFEDHPRSIHAWRDWVVESFNQNLPYDDFITWQIAGDLLPDASTPQKIATGFLRNNPTSNEGGIIDEDYRIKYLVDRVNTTSTAFLGLTMECAQCHDHKFDPLTQREYYEFAGFFNSMVGKGNTKGATAPTLRMLAPEKEKRLTEISDELAKVEEALKGTPTALTSDFEDWLAEISRPVEWLSPRILSSTHPSKVDGPAEKAPPESALRGRYVRIAHGEKTRAFLTLSEVEVYSGGRNIARTGTARQSTDYANAPAAKAIDGNADGSFGSCACTTEQEGAWWEVDLGAEVPIDHILVYNRNDCCPERLNNALVTVLDKARGVLKETRINQAPFRTVITHNDQAAPPEPGKQTYDLLVALPEGVEVPITALEISNSMPGLISSIGLEVTGDMPRTVKLNSHKNIKVGPNAAPHVVGLEAPATVKAGESLKLTINGHAPIAVRFTVDATVLSRAKLPKERDKRLAHFRNTWPGFASARQKRDSLTAEKGQIEKSATVTMIAADEGKMRTTHILMRGEYDKPGESVEPSAPGSIMTFGETLPRNRLGLAQWMVDPGNPLTARVAVNRYWQMVFGGGIVTTSEDFGTQGGRPSHQALLDHLAVDFIESGWDVKRLLRKIVTSSTYRQASHQSPSLAARDPANRLLARAPRQRLEAEFIRDNALAVSGLLVNKIGGPGVHPYQPAVLFGRNAIGAAGASFKQSSGDDLYRRSLYTYWKRQIPAANMRILGADGRNACRTRRERTNTPLQALVLLNDPQFVEAARALAERILKEGGAESRDRLAFAFRLCTSRRPTRAELSILHGEYLDRLEEFKNDPATATAYLRGGGERKPDPSLDPAELAAFAAVCSLILNLDESISKS